MRKMTALVLALGLLTLSTAWAQDEPTHRTHSRPPYSGPKKGGKSVKAHPLPMRRGQKPGQAPKTKSDHIQVR